MSGADQNSSLAAPVMLGEVRAKALMRDYGMQVPSGIVLSPDAPDYGAVAGLNPPLAVKIVSSDIIHKSDGGYVALHIHTVDEVRQAVTRMRDAAQTIDAHIEGFLVEEMAPEGIELVVGGFADPSFGPMIMFGLGGIFVEVFKDVSFRICPITAADAMDMVDDLVCRPIFDGVRGGAVVDRSALTTLLLQVGGETGVLMRNNTDITEMDLNPVIAGPDGLVVVDARVRLKGGNDA